MSNRSKLRASVRAAAMPDDDGAAVALADQLAGYLDAAGGHPTEEALEIVRICGPMYLRTLTALGLTRAGRGASVAAGTVGSAQGVSADDASHDEHRQRFAARRGDG